MNPLEIFREVATNVNNSYIRNFKAQKGKVIGYNCSFLPVGEIYHAAGMLGLRLRANEAKTTTIGDTYYGAVICSFPKYMLQMAGEGKYNFLDGLVTSTGCDAMRRMYDCWRKASEEYEGILPEFFQLLGIPHKTLDFNLEWFEEEIKIHIEKLEAHFNIKIIDKHLKKSIITFNKARNLLQEFDALRHSDSVPISGADAMAVLISSSGMPMDEYITVLKELIHSLKKTKTELPGKRLMLVGSVNDDINFINTIEEEGCVVVADTLCFGSRFFENKINENDEPISALAKGYLDDVKCPRMVGQYKARKAYMIQKAEDAAVDGVVLQNIRFCDLHGSENGVLQRDFEKLGLPCLVIEREYGSQLETGRIKMRIDAFLRRIK